MTGTADDRACGLFGKLPAKGDFITRRLPPGFVAAWDTWLQEGLTLSRDRLGESWLEAYLIAPVWRFVLPAGLIDPMATVGVLIPSIDRVGRYFPLTVAAMVEGPVSSISRAAAAEDWFVAAEELAIMALEDGLDFELFDQEVAALGVPAPVPAPAWLRRSSETWMLPVEAATPMASAMTQIAGEAVHEALGACSVWWTSGSECVAPSLVIRRGLPAATDFSALIDGLWLPPEEQQTGTGGIGMIDPSDDYQEDEPVPGLVSAAGTDVGLVRKLNEDCHLDRPDLGLWAVADGMGGHRSGDLASRSIVAALDAIQPPRTALELMTEVRQALVRANEDLLTCAAQQCADGRTDSAIVASTVVCLLIFEGHYAGVWAGDSRLYLVRGGHVIQVSHDHSVVQELLDAGLIDSEAARKHPSANQVTRAIGADDWIDLEVVQDDLHPGDAFLLCSDGITRIIEDEEIGRIVAGDEPAAAVSALIDLALSRGAPDNATAVVVRWDAEPRDGGMADG